MKSGAAERHSSLIGIGSGLLVAIIQVGFGIQFHSLVLLAGAGSITGRFLRNLSSTNFLTFSWYSGMGAIAWEAVVRLQAPVVLEAAAAKIGGVGILGASRLDAVFAITVCIASALTTWSSLHKPSSLSPQTPTVSDFLCEDPFSFGLQDLHMWELSTSEAGSLRSVLPVARELRERFGISHVMVRWTCFSHPIESSEHGATGGLTLEYGPGFKLKE